FIFWNFIVNDDRRWWILFSLQRRDSSGLSTPGVDKHSRVSVSVELDEEGVSVLSVCSEKTF
ncbi:hypothetical protein Tco_0601803, partial [Tanacetum coccineum]